MKPKYRLYFRDNDHGKYIAIWSVKEGLTQELIAITNQITNKLVKI